LNFHLRTKYIYIVAERITRVKGLRRPKNCFLTILGKYSMLSLIRISAVDILYEAAWKARESGLFICAYITGKVKHVILDEDFL